MSKSKEISKEYIGKRKRIGMNNKAQVQIIITLLFVFLAVVFLVALIPSLADTVDMGLAPDSLNCKGTDNYNATLGERSSLGCTGIKLFIPFIVLGTLVVLISKLFYGDRQAMPQMNYGGYQG